MKTESQLVIFYFCFYSLSFVFNDMVSKRSKAYVRCLYTQIKYKGITGHVRNKKWRGAYIIKELFVLHVFLKNKQNKLRQTRKDEIKEESHLNHAIVVKYAFCYHFCLFFIR